ncbi:MAG: threonylcarbamoyl-AMP synthase [Bacteroidetes bacterium]|nr:threonylcarbamoyl-AMP synthase [Bacteroidota bacterium]
MTDIGNDIHKAVQILNKEGLVAIPTETVYGLAANALNEKAVVKIFEAKQRPYFDPLIVHVANINDVKKYATINDDRLERLASTFWPGPLTLLLPKKNNLPSIVTSGLNHVGIRIPNQALTLKLLQELKFPLAAPSANPFGYISPTEPKHVVNQLKNKVEYVLDGGQCSIGIESTIIGLNEQNKISVYRLGGLSIEAIEKCIGPVEINLNISSNPKAPGQLKSHYAPKTPLMVGNIDALIKENVLKKIALIVFGKKTLTHNVFKTFNLSETENINEAAINLFSTMRLADEAGADIVLAPFLPEKGLGKAINDRLKRASVKN